MRLGLLLTAANGRMSSWLSFTAGRSRKRTTGSRSAIPSSSTGYCFEDGNGVANSQQCSTRLKQYLPDYDKGIDIRKITTEMIADAVRRAKTRDNPPCQDWPRALGTTVYKLVESIQQA